MGEDAGAHFHAVRRTVRAHEVDLVGAGHILPRQPAALALCHLPVLLLLGEIAEEPALILLYRVARHARQGFVGEDDDILLQDGDAVGRPFHDVAVLLLALAQRLLREDFLVDVGEGQVEAQWLAAPRVLQAPLEARPERRGADRLEAQLAGLRPRGLPEELEVPVVHILVRRQDETAERSPDEVLPLHAQQVRGRNVGVADKALVAQGDVAHRRQVEELEVFLALRVQLELGAAQLLVLHLKLDLVDAQLVDGRGEVVGRGRRGRGGGEPVEMLLGPPAQLGGRARPGGRARRGRLLVRLFGGGHQAKGSRSAAGSSMERRCSGSTFGGASSRSAGVCSAVRMRRPLTSSLHVVPSPLSAVARPRAFMLPTPSGGGGGGGQTTLLDCPTGPNRDHPYAAAPNRSRPAPQLPHSHLHPMPLPARLLTFAPRPHRRSASRRTRSRRARTRARRRPRRRGRKAARDGA